MSTADRAPTRLPVIAARGDLDATALAPLTAEIEAATASHPGVILDASGITFGDSSFLRLVISTHQNTDLRIAATPPVVERLFSIVGLDAVIRIYPTVHDAQAAAPAH
ncbi:anti-anti-sigma factor [Streptomyces sp. DvalAA-14]|uniref:STAS domain-containing protein n=1 Tax=unclassified Streptomyces TaxID=2593676 RepID=UPI00081B0E2E|nr:MULTISPECIES: STAS domain-containing protein [unclassified Streptomyces]MYS24541.1 STAS domain-containing protein [Streptomyces sp. SID4948]SCE47049.1 anti-anti-sigma factor [Streptomyces sp. DvalAA-14]